MAVALVQQTNGQTAGAASLGLAFGADTTTGNAIIVIVHKETSGVAASGLTTVTDGVNTFTRLRPLVNESAGNTMGINGNSGFYIATNITGAVTPTITANFQASGAAAMSIHEVSGLALLQPVDYIFTTVLAARSGGTFGFDTPSPKSAGSSILFMWADFTGIGITYTLGAGFSNLLTASNGSGPPSYGVQSKVISGLGSQTNKILSNNNSFVNEILVACFSDTDLPPYHQQKYPENYKSFAANGGISVVGLG